MEYQVLYKDCSLDVKSEKNMVCRVSKKDTRQRNLFSECQKKTLGKGASLPSVSRRHSAKEFCNFFLKKNLFAECQYRWHLAKN